jgi:hypothetical protein
LLPLPARALGAQDRWNGRIEVSDEYLPIVFAGMQTLPLAAVLEMALLTPEPAGITESISKFAFTGMPLLEIADQLRIFAPIVHDVIDVSDKQKMRYSKVYVTDDTQFTLRQAYTISGGTERALNRGRMDSLTISTADFDTLTGITIEPFKTDPFIDGNMQPAKKLTGTAYTMLTDGKVILKTSYKETITGESREIDRGSLAAYPLDFTAFESVSELEVQNG